MNHPTLDAAVRAEIDRMRRLADDVLGFSIATSHLSVDYGNLSAHLADIGSALSALGYTAKVEGLGGNTIGLVITAASAAWLLTWLPEDDEVGWWEIGEDPVCDVPTPSRLSDSETAENVAAWADDVMGHDTDPTS